MKHPLITTLAVLVSFGSAQSASANDLADAYQQARETDPQLKAAFYTTQADAEAAVQGKATLLPSINFSAETGYTRTSPDSASEGNSNNWNISLNQPVFRAQNWYSYQAGQITSEKAQVTYSQAEQTLIRRTTATYFAILQAKAVYETTQAEEAALKRRLEQVEAQFEVGLIATTDVEEAKASYDLARVARIDAMGEVYKTFQALDRLTGGSWDSVQVLAEDYPITPLTPDTYQPWVEKALENNLSLQLARYDAQTALHNRKSSKAGHYPTLDLIASYGNNDTPTMTDDQDSSYVGLSLNLPLFSGGATSSQVREAYNRWDASLQVQEDTRREVKLQTRSLFRDLLTDVDTVAARSQSIASAEKALEAIEAGYSVGTRNIVDVLDAENSLYAAIRDYQTARYNHILNQIDFKLALGTLSPEDLYQLDGWLETEAAN